MAQAQPTRVPVEVLPPKSGPDDLVLDQLADWMDTRFEIPGLRWRFGLDALLGLIPGLGDTVTFLISCYMLSAGVRLGVPRITLARMGMNVIIDFTLGSVPLLGDVFDVAWKANTRNVALIRRSLELTPHAQRRARRGDWLFVGGVAAALLVVLAATVALAWTILLWLAASAGSGVPEAAQ
jgi:hypothetical protein